MIICGIKLTHDGGVALIKDGVLEFSIEMEKINNNPRYSAIEDLSSIAEILRMYGYREDDIDEFVIDGWHTSEDTAFLETAAGGNKMQLEVAPYNERKLEEDILKRWSFPEKLILNAKKIDYSSYMHVTAHVMSAYCTSPFATESKSSFILSWDGGQYPRLYYFDASQRSMMNLGHLFFFHGTIYSIIGQYFGPYKKTEEQLNEERKLRDLEGFFGGYSIAGKIMSYIALGEFKHGLLKIFEDVYSENLVISLEFEHIFSAELKKRLSLHSYSEADILNSLHVFIENLLLKHLGKKISQYKDLEQNLCIVGGCALNIKWNNAIRSSGLFDRVWVPPFPNDSGSAIGAACAGMVERTGNIALKWNVYQGPSIIKNNPSQGWEIKTTSLKELAEILFRENQPVVFLNHNAELGPRALGNRSILAPAVDPEMKGRLNEIKRREFFRPVAPICMEEHAADIFDPGIPDPYMLFDHHVKQEWKEKVPAICHLDGTARVQTVTKAQNPGIYTLLEEYLKLSGIPLLCNTSANLNGSGFFPDVYSATEWGRVKYVWCDNVLYIKK